jgi:hypothetical protein
LSSAAIHMIYFENHRMGRAGLNNHVLPYTLCIAISNFLERDFYFDHEIPPSTLPDVRSEGKLKDALEFVKASRQSLVSNLVDIPSRRCFDIDRNTDKKLLVGDPMAHFLTDDSQRRKFESTMIWNFFSLGRMPLVREELAEFDLVEFGSNSVINASYFLFLDREAKRTILDSIRINYIREIEQLAAKIVSSLGRYNAIHVRLGDFPDFYGSDGYSVEPESFGNFLMSRFGEEDLPILIATDGFQEHEIFAAMLKGRRYTFTSDLILGEFFDDFRTLPFSDFNVLSIIDQLICGGAERFVGTCRSTFTGVIHRLRQERYSRADFDFFPDPRVRRHLGADLELVPDQQGFFDWNRFSAFSEHYTLPAWMREWNYELTAI